MDAPTPAELATAEDMRDLLSTFDGDTTISFSGMNLVARRIQTDVSYNARSQRFEVVFSAKPPEEVRESLKAMCFNWNRFEGAWELYAWQARTFEREQLAYYLEALNRGVAIPAIADIPAHARRVWWKDLDQTAKDHVSELAEAVRAARDDIRGSEAFEQLLKVAELLHEYSWNNCFLIMVQCPHASLVMSERKWNKLGRTIMDREPPILILAPRFKKVKERDNRTGKMEEKKKLWGFLSVPVYDVSQTEGEPLPTITVPQLDGEDGKVFLEAMKGFCKEHSIEAQFLDLSGEDYSGISKGGSIEVDVTTSINQQVSLIIHEVAHEYSKFGADPKAYATIPVRLRETIAEGTAYVVLRQLRLPTTAPEYLTLQGVTEGEVKGMLTAIAEASKVLITYLIQRTGWNLDQSVTLGGAE